jgi:carbon-monoxide dehydrogenase large subunit
MAFAYVVRSQKPHGKIRKITTDVAASMPGVLSVLTADGLSLSVIRPRIAAMPNFDKFLQLPLATDKVRYVGEPVAVVVAESPYQAEDAASLVEVEIEDLPPILDWATASALDVFIHDQANSNISTKPVARGDWGVACAKADKIFAERFTVHRHAAIPMETRGLVATWSSDRRSVTVYGSTKVPYFNRSLLSDMFGIDEDAVILKSGNVGGGFGVRGEFYPEDFLIPLIAKNLGRPVKWIEDRREHFLATNHSRESWCELQLACNSNGKILGMKADLFFDLGAYARGTGGTAPTRCAQFLPGPYDIDHFECVVNAYVSNKTPSGTYRGPGRVEANFFRERLIDIAAAGLGLDPAEIRRRNLIKEEQLPYNIGSLVDYEGPAEYDNGDYHAAFAKALDEIKWDQRSALQGKQVDGWYMGTGLACFVESGAGGNLEKARMRLQPDGSIGVIVGAASSGQGHETIFAQICSDTLRVPFDLISVRCASTDELSQGFGTWHSRSAVMSGNAVKNTAGLFYEQLQAEARSLLGGPNSEIEFVGGVFFSDHGRKSVSLKEMAAELTRVGRSIDLEGSFEHVGKKPFSYGTHAAHVAVNPRNGRVKIIDFIAIEDIGTIINPLVAHGQSLGAIVQGLGGVFLEELVYDDAGQLLTASFADYRVPTATDFPNIRSLFINSTPAPGNPLGAKGAGEGGIVAVAAAISNAVSAALAPLGVGINQLPISPPRLWELLHQEK